MSWRKPLLSASGKANHILLPCCSHQFDISNTCTSKIKQGVGKGSPGELFQGRSPYHIYISLCSQLQVCCDSEERQRKLNEGSNLGDLSCQFKRWLRLIQIHVWYASISVPTAIRKPLQTTA